MSDRVNNLLSEMGGFLGGLPGVFSAAQWGGRAFKLPGPGGNRRKPKLLAFVSTETEADWVGVSFKLPPERAAWAIDKYAWLEPHSFRTLAPSGWVHAEITSKRQIGPLTRLLEESRALYPQVEEPPVVETERGGGLSGGAGGGGAVTRRIDQVMADALKDGWSPPPAEDDGFDD
ncbi:MAG: hypothetical protein JSV91_06945 [Phycisphaerales bacterium]|nr:MAG: hypothetical protein JSV91_06945 [Phycisphaerales bacterium]